jgi:hypothetical protein
MKLKFLALLLIATRLNAQNTVQDSLHLSLIDSNLKAQTQNQLSQALYYSNSKSNIDLVPIISVLIAGLISFGSASYLSIRALKNEREKTLAIQEKEFSTAKKLAASALVSKTAQGIHYVTWVLWIARFTPELFNESLLKDHDKKMDTLYSEIVAAQVVLAAYDKKLYKRTKVIVDKLYGLDGIMGGIAAGLYKPSERPQSIEDLGNLWLQSYEYLKGLPALFSSKLEDKS